MSNIYLSIILLVFSVSHLFAQEKFTTLARIYNACPSKKTPSFDFTFSASLN